MKHSNQYIRFHGDQNLWFFILTAWSFTTSLRMMNEPNFNNFAIKRTQRINNPFHIMSLPAYFYFQTDKKKKKKKNLM